MGLRSKTRNELEATLELKSLSSQNPKDPLRRKADRREARGLRKLLAGNLTFSEGVTILGLAPVFDWQVAKLGPTAAKNGH